MSISEAAKRLGITESFLKSVELGEEYIDNELMAKVHAVYSSENEIFELKDDEDKDNSSAVRRYYSRIVSGMKLREELLLKELEELRSNLNRTISIPIKTSTGEALWPGMWVRKFCWRRRRAEASPLDACYLWRVEQHDGVMLLAGQGEDVLVPLTQDISEECVLIQHPKDIELAMFPDEWAALRKLGWGVYLCNRESGASYILALHCQRGNQWEYFSLTTHWELDLRKNPEMVRTLLRVSWWRLKHPKYADALARQQPADFWRWPMAPATKELHAMGLMAWRTEEGKIEISPDGSLKATGRKSWDLPFNEQED